MAVLREHDSDGVRRTGLSNTGEGGCFDEYIGRLNGWCEGLAAWVHGDQSAAGAAFEDARKELAEEVNNQADYAGWALRTQGGQCSPGNKEAAIRRGERAIELIPISTSAIEGATLVRLIAIIYGGDWLRGEKIARSNGWLRQPTSRQPASAGADIRLPSTVGSVTR